MAFSISTTSQTTGLPMSTQTYRMTPASTTGTIQPNPTLAAIPLRVQARPYISSYLSPLEELVDFQMITTNFLWDIERVTSGSGFAMFASRKTAYATAGGEYAGQLPYLGEWTIVNSEYCRVTNPNGTRSLDCMRACMMPDTLMRPRTVNACLRLAVMSMWLRNGSYVLDSSDPITKSDLSSIGIANLTAFNGERVVALMSACLSDSCRDTKLGTCNEKLRKIGDVPVKPESLLDIGHTMQHYCANTPSPANADIAGPGVIISYIIQTVLAFGGGILLKLFTSWLRWSFFPFTVLAQLFSSKARAQSRSRDPSDRGCAPGTKRLWTRTKHLQTRLARTRPNAALISSLVEFQEVQAYFLFAIQLATIITFRNDTEGLSLNGIINFPMAQFSANVVSFLSIDGLLPVLFVQICLQRAGMRWWYTLAITCLVYLFAEIVQARRTEMVPDFEFLWQHFRSQGSVTACGGNPTPMTYCSSSGFLRGSLTSGLSLFAARCIIFALVVDMMIWFAKAKWPRLERTMRSWDRKSAWVRWPRNKLLPALWSLYFGGLQVFLMFALSASIDQLSGIAKIVGMSPDTWSFGQLVAVMVWAPIVGKYLYFNIFGIEEGFGRRLAKHYRIVHDPESSADEDDDVSLDDHHIEAQNGIEMKLGFNSSCESQTSVNEGVLPAPTSMTTPVAPQAPTATVRMRSNASIHEPSSPYEPTVAPQGQQMQAVMVGGVMIEVEDVPPSAHGHPTS